MNSYGRLLACGGLAILAGLGALAAPAKAQTYPTRSITMIVPFAAGDARCGSSLRQVRRAMHRKPPH